MAKRKSAKGLPTAGAASGPGRLQKVELHKRHKNKPLVLEGEVASKRGDRKER